MSPELAAIHDFLSECLPFDQLPNSVMEQVVSDIEVSYHSKGSQFGKQDLEGGLRVVRSGAAELRCGKDLLLDRLAEGDSFNLMGLNVEQPGVKATLIEDALIYTLPEIPYQKLRSEYRAFDRFFSSQRSRRVRRAARHEPVPNDMMRPLSDLMSSVILSVEPSTTIQKTAALMSESRFSSILVMIDEGLVGIVTDRDIRSRAVAKGLSLDEPVTEIMTPDPLTLLPSCSVFDATLFMTQRGIHHIPIMEDKKVTGIITASDLMLARKDDPVFLVQHISRQTTIQELKKVVAAMPDLLVQWVNAGIRSHQLSHVLTALSDAVTVRLIELAIEEMGPAPVPFSWLGFGSQGRKEQLLGADQDNALLISDDMKPEHEQWFSQLATYVCDGLNECGYVYCPGDIMATNEKLRQPLREWLKTVERWMRSPTDRAVMEVSIFFDIRTIYGDNGLTKNLQTEMLKHTKTNSIFLAALAQNVLSTAPPMGIFRRFVVEQNGEHAHELNLKKRGVIPIIDIIRLHALAHGLFEVNTIDRLEALVECKALTIVDSRNIQDALQVLMQLRLVHQAEEIVKGQKPSNYVNPASLSKIVAKQLKDAFGIVKDAQQGVKLKYRPGLG
ncbi:MAG: nucleotidyltransferase [Oleispira sp.]|nr:nucleotidyltransferase [Oleispira sp.]|tara:strand:+ start:740 stop:2581 length:1842 start_codon:yes stop_codon:yes gene_type:complete